MGDFNHWDIKWDTLQCTRVEDQQFLCLVQDNNFLTQSVLEPSRATTDQSNEDIRHSVVFTEIIC